MKPRRTSTCALHPFAWTIAAAGALGLAACGGSVKTSDEGASGEGGGGTGSVTAAGTGGAGGAPGKACGGLLGVECEADEWCDYDGSCGDGDSGGACTPRPHVCDADCPGVCGCDGVFYCNECAAHAVGVDTSPTASCAEDSAHYSAESMPGGLDHLLIRKADKARDVCVTVHLASPIESAPGFAFDVPEGWGVQNAWITGKASDCFEPGMLGGQGTSATGGEGTISFTLPSGGYFPCDVTVHGSLAFPKDAPWILPSEPLDAEKVSVTGGCF